MTTGPSPSARLGQSPQPARSHSNRVFDGPSGRILCVADIRGQHSLLNQLAAETNARAIIHTGDFGFFENASLDRINDRTLRHLLLYSPLIPNEQRENLYPKDATAEKLRDTVKTSPPHLSEFPLLLSGKLKLSVPVYTVWGACEDVTILEKFRTGEYDVENLHVIDEATSRTLEIGGIKLRLFGLGGAFVAHKLFDNGEGSATIAGGAGTMWTTALQIGELVDTAQKTFDPTETRLLVTHASPGREGLLAQLALVLKADLTVSAALHFRYASSWNEFSVQNEADGYRAKLASGQKSFLTIWESVKTQVESVMDENQKLLLEKALMVSERVPPLSSNGAADKEEPAWKNTWNWNLCDATFGHLVLDIRDGRISAELKSQGFNYGYRRAAPAPGSAAPASAGASKVLPSATPSPAPVVSSNARLPPQPGGSRPLPNGTPSSSPAPLVASKSPGPAKSSQLSPPVKTSVVQVPNGANSTAPSPKSPATEVARSTASPAPSSGKPEKQKRLSNAAKREKKTAKERAAGEADTPKDASKPASPAPGALGLNAGPIGKHTKKGSKASAGVASPTSAPSPIPTPGPDATRQTAASPLGAAEGPNAARSPPQSRTQSLAGSRRYPWTLYLSKLPVPVTEQEVRDCFQDAKGSISFVKLPYTNGTGPNRTQKPIAFVEFRDEDSMRVALSKSSKKIKDQDINMSVADNRERTPQSEDFSNNHIAGNEATQDGGSMSPSSSQPNGGFRGGPPSRGSFRGRGRGSGLFAHARGGLVQNAQQGGGRGGGRKGSLDGTAAPTA